MRSQQRLRIVIFALAMVVIAPYSLTAQQTSASTTCDALLRTAMSQIGSNCAGLAQNQTCYGHPTVSVTSADTSSDPSFSQPAQQMPLTDVALVRTSALSLSDNTWGIAPTSIQANLPVGLLGKGVVLIPMGEIEIENAVRPESTLILPQKPVDVVAAGETSLFDMPTNTGHAIGIVKAKTILQADGISADSQWLRVYYEYQHDFSIRAAAWVKISNLAPVKTENLPVITLNSQTPMQSFYLRGKFEASACQQMPTLLYVQGPKDIESDIKVNGATISISSAITLRITPNNKLRVDVLSGIVTLNPDKPTPLILPAGYTAEICLSTSARDLGNDGVQNDHEVDPECQWSTPRQISLADLDALRQLQGIPGNVMNYQLVLPGLVCPSGVGEPVCETIITDPNTLESVRSLCDKNVLTPFICQTIRGL